MELLPAWVCNVVRIISQLCPQKPTEKKIVILPWLHGRKENNTLPLNINKVTAFFYLKMLIQQNDSNCVEHCQYSNIEIS